MSTITRQQIEEMLDGLKEEIAQVEAEAQRRIKKLRARGEVFEEMLAELQPKQRALIPTVNADADESPLRTFLSQALADGRPREHSELVKLVEGHGKLVRGKTVPGRAVHGALMAMKQQGMTKKENGMWMAIKGHSQMAKG